MGNIIDWLQSAPSGSITILTTTIGALVAVLVVVLTQWILGRRARTELLTSKLEELYLLLNQAASENAKRYERLAANLYRVGNNPDPPPLDSSMYSLDVHKKIIMYIRLYFPRLAPAHIRMFKNNSEVTEVLHAAESGKSPDSDQIRSAFTKYGNTIRNMEEEIINNRSILVRDTIIPRRYKVSDNQVPMPNAE